MFTGLYDLVTVAKVYINLGHPKARSPIAIYVSYPGAIYRQLKHCGT